MLYEILSASDIIQHINTLSVHVSELKVYTKPQLCVVICVISHGLFSQCVSCVSSGDPEGLGWMWGPHHSTGDSSLLKSEQQDSVWEALCWLETSAQRRQGKTEEWFKTSTPAGNKYNKYNWRVWWLRDSAWTHITTHAVFFFSTVG